jgi:hypothetical protein
MHQKLFQKQSAAHKQSGQFSLEYFNQKLNCSHLNFVFYQAQIKHISHTQPRGPPTEHLKLRIKWLGMVWIMLSNTLFLRRQAMPTPPFAGQ